MSFPSDLTQVERGEHSGDCRHWSELAELPGDGRYEIWEFINKYMMLEFADETSQVLEGIVTETQVLPTARTLSTRDL